MNLGGLAWRNTIRSFPRRWPVVVILAAAVAVLEVGNTLFESATEGLERTYVRSFAGQWTISAQSDERFTIFGNELPLIGEYQVLPVLPGAQDRIEQIRAKGGQSLGQVTAAGVLSVGNWNKPVPVFGVEFQDYFSFFPDLTLVAGSLQNAQTRSLVMNEAQYEEVSAALGSPPAMGTAFTVSVFNDHSFTIREVILRAVYRYPVRDGVLNRIALVDPDTARSLNGYVYGTLSSSQGSARGSSASDLDSLFENTADLTTLEGPGLTENTVENLLADSTEREASNATKAGTWNFVLIQDGTPRLSDLLALWSGDRSVQIRGWRDTAGGNALVVWLLQCLFNAGLAFVTVAAALVGINGLSLSVAERTRELGTLRALGATKSRVAGLVTLEAMLLVTGAGLTGVAVGAGAVIVLGSVGVLVTNPYLQALFGAQSIHPTVSVGQILFSGTFSLILGLAAVVLPVHKAVSIAPVAAMSKV